MKSNHIATLRLLAGFAFAPIMPGLLVIFVGMVLGGSSNDNPAMLLWFLGLAAVLSYPIACVLGVPIYFILRWRGYESYVAYLLAGGLLGAIDCFVCELAELGSSEASPQVNAHLWATTIKFLPLGIINGALAGTAFWIIARPDLRTSS